jgi:hypothetical protein
MVSPSSRPTTNKPENPARKDEMTQRHTYLIMVVADNGHELMRQEVTGAEMIVLAVAETMEKYGNVVPVATTLIPERRPYISIGVGIRGGGVPCHIILSGNAGRRRRTRRPALESARETVTAPGFL